MSGIAHEIALQPVVVVTPPVVPPSIAPEVDERGVRRMMLRTALSRRRG